MPSRVVPSSMAATVFKMLIVSEVSSPNNMSVYLRPFISTEAKTVLAPDAWNLSMYSRPGSVTIEGGCFILFPFVRGVAFGGHTNFRRIAFTTGDATEFPICFMAMESLLGSMKSSGIPCKRAHSRGVNCLSPW